jgi:hypothetical protein
MNDFILIEIGYKSCGWYKQLEGKWKGKCESNTRCDYCENCPYNPEKKL